MYTTEVWFSKTKDKALREHLHSVIKRGHKKRIYKSYADAIISAITWKTQNFKEFRGRLSWDTLYNDAINNLDAYASILKKGSFNWWISKIEDSVVKNMVKGVYKEALARNNGGNVKYIEGCRYSSFDEAIDQLCSFVTGRVLPELRFDIDTTRDLVKRNVIQLKGVDKIIQA